MFLGLELFAPLPVIIGITILVVGLLLLRFIIKTAITLGKIALLVGVGVATWMALAWIMDRVG